MVKGFFTKIKKGSLVFPAVILLTMPASTNYELKSYEFGGGGTDNSSSSNYSVNALTGETNNLKGASTNYQNWPGLTYTQMANVPPAPTFQNSSNWYNKLQYIVNNGGNPSDTEFTIAISSDDFVTTNYIQADGTTGASAVWQTYADWGGASGEYAIGLDPNTTYKIKVKARQGNYTESPFGPTASAATSQVLLTFDIDISSTDTSTSPPYNLSIGDISTSSVTTASDKIWVTLETNANNGGLVYIKSANSGLTSSSVNTTITSSTADLSVASSGYGLQGSSKTQTSGGPLEYFGPYNGSGENVGVVDSSIRGLFNTSNSPIVGGRGAMAVKVKASVTTPAASDYTDTLTLIAAGGF